MPKVAKELSALDVKRLQHPQSSANPVARAVGGVAGLYLQLSASGAKSWLLKAQLMSGKRREMGLGPYPEVSLADAREEARELKAQIRTGLDPMLERQKLRAQERAALTFTGAMDAYVADGGIDHYSTDKSRNLWISSMGTHVLPHIGDMRVGDIETPDVLGALEPIWISKHDTAARLRGRIEDVLDWATHRGHREGENPAKWTGSLKFILKSKNKSVPKSVSYAHINPNDVPSWFRQLQEQDAASARALEFLTLTAVRSGEVRGTRWDEIDFDKRVWEIPAERMKMKRPHIVPLTDAAIALLQTMPRDNELVFPAARGGAMSDMTLSALMKRMHAKEPYLDKDSKKPAVVHGMRSTFKSWAMECTNFENELSEVALAHQIGSKVQQSYVRTTMPERRRPMMEAWSNYLHGVEVENVVPLHGAANG